MTPLQIHRKKYERGCGNAICDGAKNVCIVRGTVPADVLLVGEAPGRSEDVLGRPFVGPAGHLLDRIIADAGLSATPCPVCHQPTRESPGGITCPNGHGGVVDRSEFEPGLRLAWTNLVGCIPLDEDGNKTAEPEHAEIKQCSGRLQELIRLARPRLIVTVGALGTKYCPIPAGVKTVAITHPAAILRANPAAQGLMAQKCVVQLRDAVESLL